MNWVLGEFTGGICIKTFKKNEDARSRDRTENFEGKEA